MISYKASVAQKCVLLRFNDLQWSLTNPRSPKYVSYLDSMIVNDLLQSLGHPNMCLFLESIIVNDLLQSLGRPKTVFIWSLWSSMISYKASVAQICVLFRFNDRQWSLTNPRSPNKCFYLVSMIVNDLLQSLGRPNMCLFRLYDRQWSLTKPRSPKYASYMALYDREWSFMKPRSPKYASYLDSMVVNDLLQCLSRLNICLIWTQWSSMFF